MVQPPVACPLCAKTTGVFKVSHLYLAAVAEQDQANGAQSIAPQLSEIDIPRGFAARPFIQKFAPPAGKVSRMRLIHPDWSAGALALISLFFLYQIFVQQTGLFLYAVGGALLTFGLYLFFRQRLVQRYTQTLAEEAAQKAHVEKAVEMWINLYYCSTEDLIFDPRSQKTAPAADLAFFIAEEVKAGL